MEWGFPVMTGFPSYGREFYIGVCRPGTAFLDGLTSRGDTVGMLGHDKLCLIISRHSRGPRDRRCRPLDLKASRNEAL